jgi:hypothetical protein
MRSEACKAREYRSLNLGVSRCDVKTICGIKEWCLVDAISKIGAVWDVFALQCSELFARQAAARLLAAASR